MAQSFQIPSSTSFIAFVNWISSSIGSFPLEPPPPPKKIHGKGEGNVICKLDTTIELDD